MLARKLIIFLFLLAAGCSVKQYQEVPAQKAVLASRPKPYFIPVAIVKLSSIQSPCVEIEIEDRQFIMELDLGFQGDLIITKDSFNLIASKDFIREKQMYGFRGKQYPTNLYRILKVKIGKMTFNKPILQEGDSEFINDSVSVENGGPPSPQEPGRLGWKLFYNVNLLIDMKNSQIAFCDSIETLENQGYPINTLTKTSLYLERGLVEIFAATGEGSLRCMLDTGATWNILNTELREGVSLDQAMWDRSNILNYPSLKIEGNDFGQIAFHRIPINLPIDIDAILGMEFFQDQLVFLDFKNRCGYFSKKPLDDH